MSLTKRKRNLYDPKATAPYKLSRSRLENFVRCQRCFYLDRRLGIDRPSMPGFTLNVAVDELLKKEFDHYRVQREPHPLMKENSIEAIPYQHPDLARWRDNFKGITCYHHASHFEVSGAIDDIWQHKSGELIIVDYKATSKDGRVTLDDQWKQAYKRQMEIYQWLFRQNGFGVASTAYFVYANALKTPDRFSAQLKFDIQLIPYAGDDSWVEGALLDAQQCLAAAELPPPADDCEFCAYRALAREVE